METTSDFRPSTLAQLLALAEGIALRQIELSMRPEAAYRFGLTQAIVIALGLQPPVVLSAYRSHAEQRQLKDLGRPTARRSLHTVGLAYDLNRTANGFPTFVEIWKLLGGRSGIDFDNPDPAHVDFPVPGIDPDPSY